MIIRKIVAIVLTFYIIVGVYCISGIFEKEKDGFNDKKIVSVIDEIEHVEKKENKEVEKISEKRDKQELDITNIRVVLMDSGYKDIYHNSVKVSSKDGVRLVYKKNGNDEKLVDKNINITPTSSCFKENKKVCIENVEKNKGTEIKTIKRSQEGLLYKGRLYIIKEGNKLVVVNELSLEEYLYSVVPSEMPEYFPLEALKAQAICARTYAAKRIYDGAYKKYDAHLDDSVSYQVYNNMNYGKESKKAVDDTRGKILYYKNKIAQIYFYSTSSGYSSSSKDVFGGEAIPYLNSKKLIYPQKSGYIEKDCEWFKWRLTTDVDKLSGAVNNNLASICGKNGHKDIKIYNKKKKNYKVGSISDLGKIKSISVGKKASGGIVSRLNISGSKKKIQVTNQYTIRRVLSGVDGTLKNNKGKNVNTMSMLPSGYFTIKKSGKKIIINGGGYGHGVGLSQWGAAKLAEEGYKYDDILRYYFNGINIEKYDFGKNNDVK